jgi:hypothetical protein
VSLGWPDVNGVVGDSGPASGVCVATGAASSIPAPFEEGEKGDHPTKAGLPFRSWFTSFWGQCRQGIRTPGRGAIPGRGEEGRLESGWRPGPNASFLAAQFPYLSNGIRGGRNVLRNARDWGGGRRERPRPGWQHVGCEADEMQ